MNATASELIIYFPEYRKEIKELIARDCNFVELARDFIYCKNEIKKLQTSPQGELFIQYQETLKDLEEELLSFINENKE